MMTIAQQIAARSPVVANLTRDTFASQSIQAGCAYLLNIVGPTIAGGLFALPAPVGDRLVGEHRGCELFVSEGGYHSRASIAVHFGYCDTVEELIEEIDDYFEEERERWADIDNPADTPRLDTSFHDHEMNVG